ncbi:MAG: Gfo/Idh/MocA family oxidoreductase, partial [bacterium]
MLPQTSIRAGVIGFGYWGPNLARNIAACPFMELVAIADLDHERRTAARRAYPGVEVDSDADALMQRDDIDLIVIATPPKTHFELAAAAVAVGKHVLVEKPFVTEVSQAEELVASAAAAGVHLFVDHTFLFTGAVRHIREDLLSLGDLLYYDATRTNLGTFQTGTDVLWDLAPHDFSILLSLVDQPLERIAAMGASHAASPGPTMAYVTLRFAGGLLAHLHLNWMAPAKVRRTIIGGSRKMLV